MARFAMASESLLHSVHSCCMATLFTCLHASFPGLSVAHLHQPSPKMSRELCDSKGQNFRQLLSGISSNTARNKGFFVSSQTKLSPGDRSRLLTALTFSLSPSEHHSNLAVTG